MALNEFGQRLRDRFLLGAELPDPAGAFQQRIINRKIRGHAFSMCSGYAERRPGRHRCQTIAWRNRSVPTRSEGGVEHEESLRLAAHPVDSFHSAH